MDRFTDSQLSQLRAAYGSLERMDPCGPSCKRLVAILDKASPRALRQLESAGINFVSALARNRIARAA